MGIASPVALAICEGFITRLIKSKHDLIKIKIDDRNKLVECNDNTLKQYLDIIFKSCKLDIFYHQFIALLNSNNFSSIKKGELKCRISNTRINLAVSEKCSLPNFEWKIIREVE